MSASSEPKIFRVGLLTDRLITPMPFGDQTRYQSRLIKPTAAQLADAHEAVAVALGRQTEAHHKAHQFRSLWGSIRQMFASA